MGLKAEKRRNANLNGINMIEMPIQPTLGIGHNISGVGLPTPLRVGTQGYQSDHENLMTG